MYILSLIRDPVSKKTVFLHMVSKSTHSHLQ